MNFAYEKEKKNEAKSQTPRVKDVKEIKTTNEVMPSLVLN